MVRGFPIFLVKLCRPWLCCVCLVGMTRGHDNGEFHLDAEGNGFPTAPLAGTDPEIPSLYGKTSSQQQRFTVPADVDRKIERPSMMLESKLPFDSQFVSLPGYPAIEYGIRMLARIKPFRAVKGFCDIRARSFDAGRIELHGQLRAGGLFGVQLPGRDSEAGKPALDGVALPVRDPLDRARWSNGMPMGSRREPRCGSQECQCNE